ncbi:MAG: alanine--tRNA ligase [Chloroflexota bacterium]
MTGDEIRKAYLDFFTEKGHLIIPSSSLIPEGDPTLLLTTAGMVQFKPYFMGEMEPPARCLASCQKCFRTTDIESVGDANHLTLFEMLGNFSIGDYFKEEAINWAWEFVTERLVLPRERLWITVFLDDDEAAGIWRGLGVPDDRIVRFGEKDNFWGPAGSSGPCGPCSEIHYDFGPDVGCRQPSCQLGCSCGRFSEIWNLVFTQYNQDTAGNRTPLPRPNIDTGMGLERITTIMQGKHSVYETDIFAPLIATVSSMAGRNFGEDESVDNTMRIIAEHGRAITFLIADGVMPSNEGRGYVLRRLLRRGSLFGRRLDIDRSFLTGVTATTIQKMGHAYPEIVERKDFILQVIEDEEKRFRRTLGTGLELLDGMMEMLTSKGEREIPGEGLFKLYDTYGFPVEMTSEIAAERGFSVDIKGFEREMAKQRERARAASRFDVTAGAVEKAVTAETKVEFKGYETIACQAKVLRLLVDHQPVDALREGQEAGIILDVTPFYGEMGGQVGDIGKIVAPGGEFLVTNTAHLLPEVILHEGRLVKGSLATGDEVTALVDCESRSDIARNHTATHLLHSALHRVLGEHAQQRGSLVARDRLRFDFSHLKALTAEELGEIQHIVNDDIRRNLRVTGEEMPYRKAIESGAIALFNEKYGNTVRVIRVGEPNLSTELCGGTHVLATGEIGFFRIVSESSIGSGLRRIEAVTGRGAEEFVEKQLTTLESVAGKVGVSTSDVFEKIESIVSELDKEHRQRQALEKELSRRLAVSFLSRVAVVNGVNVLAEVVPPSRLEVLREMSDFLKDELKSAVIVLGTVPEDKPAFLAVVTPDLVVRGYHAGEIIKKVAQVTGGGGGGRPGMAQAGGRDSSKLDEAIKLVKELIKANK